MFATQTNKNIMDPIKILEKRLKHQQEEVKEARKNVGLPAFSKAYLNRMVGNVKQTKKMLFALKKRVK